MANRVREFIESIIYAGMKPGARTAEGEPAVKSGFFTRFVNGPAHADPLYLTNQTFAQKTRRALLLVSPVILVLVIGLVAVRHFSAKPEDAPKQLTAAELAAKTLPDFNKEIKLDTNRNIEVTEVRFDHGVMVGNLRNTTTHPIVQAVVTFELADAADSRLGGVTVTEENLPPGVVRPFKKSIDQGNAASALVREVETK